MPPKSARGERQERHRAISQARVRVGQGCFQVRHPFRAHSREAAPQPAPSTLSPFELSRRAHT